MKLAAILMARYLGLVETSEFDRNGRLYFPDLVKAVVSRFGFLKFPTSIEELDGQKGVDFFDGKWGEVVVNKLTLYTNGFLVETRSNTADSERVLNEALQWAASEFNLVYDPSMIRRKAYISHLTFYSDVQLLAGLNRALSKLSDRLREVVRPVVDANAKYQRYEPVALSLNCDFAELRNPQSAFTIQRRIETAFSENKYFSEAPLPTDIHVQLLEAFEADLLTGS